MKEITTKEVKQVVGGARTDKETCTEAGMKWTADKGTKSDGKGACTA
ncbi:MAG: hypothetical protein Q7S87_00800 [Agitococcus sp.]|nr:hypothetical protein [Agitococcus sp.]MDO9177138.1 hypothetical protein [Agitococcus sp.]